MKAPTIARMLALFIAALLTALIALLGYLLAINLSHDTARNSREAGVALIVAGLPLALLNLGMTIYLRHRRATRGRILAWMWIPPLAGFVSLFAIAAIAAHIEASLASAHPPVSEMHINLSGRDQWLVRGHRTIHMPDRPEEPTHVERTRDRRDMSDPMAEYEGQRLAPGFKTMDIFLDERQRTTPARVPVIAAPGPDLAALAPALTEWWEAHLSHVYYHYPDRIEVATSFYIRDGRDRPATANVPLVNFVIHNMSAHISRLEIDGQALAGPYATMSPDDGTCNRLPEQQAINRLAAPLNVRWQQARTAPAWQQATAALPSFPPLTAQQGKPKDNAVHLYFLPDGSVTAQRVQTLTLADGRQGVRSTAPAMTYKFLPACGAMSDSENEN